ncbi:MAG: hypothetical protein AAGJ35_09700, partial [Myxococcota bacterium]
LSIAAASAVAAGAVYALPCAEDLYSRVTSPHTYQVQTEQISKDRPGLGAYLSTGFFLAAVSGIATVAELKKVNIEDDS